MCKDPFFIYILGEHVRNPGKLKRRDYENATERREFITPKHNIAVYQFLEIFETARGPEEPQLKMKKEKEPGERTTV